MPSTLKGRNALWLSTLMGANLIIFYTVVQNQSILAGNWFSLVQNAGSAIPAGIGMALTGIINTQLTSDTKARIVFLRWDNPLPGSEAFSKYIKCDPRIDLSSLRKFHGPFPTKPREQNALWYRFYKTVESEAAVVEVHRAFLFARDYASLALIIGVVLGTLACFQVATIKGFLSYVVFLILQFALARRAASNHGIRFVTTVLALKSAGR